MSALVLACLLLASPDSHPLYRWRDRVGVEHVTTTPPPVGSTPLDVPPPENVRENAQGAGLSGSLAQSAASGAAPDATLNPAQRIYWHGVEARLLQARLNGDASALASTGDGILREALWGSGLWALPALPAAILLLALLLGWWACSGRRRPVVALVMTAFALGGLVLSHFALTHYLYRAQSIRLKQNLTLLPHYLGGGVRLRPAHQRALLLHLQSLDATVTPLAPPWAYPREVLALRETVKLVVVEP